MKKVINFIEDNFIYFSIYSFIGWIYEVSWFLIVRHKFVNRGDIEELNLSMKTIGEQKKEKNEMGITMYANGDIFSSEVPQHSKVKVLEK